jgi:alkylated DNA nucleotide flippase Atl1
VLRSLEEDHRHAEPVNYNSAKLTIEHILPQSMTKDWMKMLSRDALRGESLEEIHGRVVHTLGNLTLTAYNSKLSNDSFQVKQKILRDSGLAMNREIADSDHWTQVSILERGRKLGDRIVAIWPGPDESVSSAASSPRWSLLSQIVASIPPGRWTSYLDLAEVMGSHQNSVVSRLWTLGPANVHRVLRRDGVHAADFRWSDPDRNDDPKVALGLEGVRFDATGKASQDQRMTALDLADAVGLMLGEDGEE